jgi:glyoxylase-like metal-dependent hydrolase (beta-lactamase superfamily II)
VIPMKTRVITPNLIQLTKLGFVNAYLVREDDGFTVVDTTMGGAAGDIVAAARANGGEVRRIALTHGHDDHVGSLDALKTATGVDVYMPEVDMRIVSGEKTGYGKLPGGWKGFSTKPEVLLNHGDRVGSLEVIATPGHTPGHVSFIDTRDRALLAGDAILTFAGVSTPAKRHWRFPLVGFATWDKAKATESARMLAGLSPSLLATGHGKVVRDPSAALAKALR